MRTGPITGISDGGSQSQAASRQAREEGVWLIHFYRIRASVLEIKAQIGLGVLGLVSTLSDPT